MTLVLACITKDIVYQISDRRLTNLASPGAGAVDDESNKAVVVNGRVTFGYTGLSKIGSMRTDDWLARVIADGATDDMAQVLERIRERATVDFNRMRWPPKWKCHAFQGVGWFRPRGDRWLLSGNCDNT